MKKCSRCKEIKDESEFTNNKANKNGLSPYCKSCLKKYSIEYYKKKQYIQKEKARKYYIAHREEILKRNKVCRPKLREYNKNWRKKNHEKCNEQVKKRRKKLKIDIFNVYGGCKCVCCGETLLEFLSIDHINGGGNLERKNNRIRGGVGTYEWLKKNNYPSGYQVLCHNCNQAKGYFGYCPHQKIKEGTYESMA